ncbi:Ribulose-phosphate 3-epimerase [Metamycoplasma auris 15026]|uniref:Ribulose-phosphate 3-epimerase n=1 Tax=Metamycoplasma auris 15026 TaxID=1188233 RepID=N9TT35_9BACT|nr:ribulose-phosphate 3-epimerase [Metamycoplasma auris]ENY69200.1 Ribulose-phosphate 3-epimerase [Metamycoplasma auris 15026]
MQYKISPSILDVQPDNMVSYVSSLIEWEVSNVHYDVMDGIFVPNKALEFEKIQEIKENCKKHTMDIHLMVADVFKYYEMYKEIGDILTFHYEAFKNKDEFLKLVQFAKKDKIKLGLAINPDTDITSIFPYLKYLDLVLVMSVFPGLGGQVFIEGTLQRIKALKEFITQNNLDLIIQIDGGIKGHNIKACYDAGVTLAVVGSYLVKNFSKNEVKRLTNWDNKIW